MILRSSLHCRPSGTPTGCAHRGQCGVSGARSDRELGGRAGRRRWDERGAIVRRASDQWGQRDPPWSPAAAGPHPSRGPLSSSLPSWALGIPHGWTRRGRKAVPEGGWAALNGPNKNKRGLYVSIITLWRQMSVSPLQSTVPPTQSLYDTDLTPS